MPITIDLTEDDDDVDDLAASLASASLGGPPAPRRASQGGPHASLEAMLSLAELVRRRVAGDGNCAYYAACASLDPDHLRTLGFRAIEHGAGGASSATQSDLRLQREVRGRVADFLQRPENAHHRYVGTSAQLLWDEASQKHVAAPPPPASAMDAHRRDGEYAQTPQLRGLAEVLSCCVVSLDSDKLYDRVPVFTHGQAKTLRLRSWRDEVAPILRRSESLVDAMPTIVIVNNGRSDAGGHFDATARRR